MTYSTGQGNAQPGWYPDPAGSPQVRWWDGVRWTEHVSAAAAPAQALTRPPLRPGTPIFNVAIWAVVFLPLVTALAELLWNPQFTFETVNGEPVMNPASVFTVGYFVILLVQFLVYAAVVVCAYFDWSRLRRDGVVRPFHWAFAFIPGSLVYVIGRSVVVRKVAGSRALWPVWAIIGVEVVAIALGIVRAVLLLSAMMSQLPPSTFG